LAADVAHHPFVPEDRRMRIEVFLAKRAEEEPVGLKDRSFGYHFFPRVRPPKRLLKRATWPPSWTWRVPPTQAGCTFGSISRCNVSPSLPQVERSWNLVPSVISTVIM